MIRLLTGVFLVVVLSVAVLMSKVGGGCVYGCGVGGVWGEEWCAAIAGVVSVWWVVHGCWRDRSCKFV